MAWNKSTVGSGVADYPDLQAWEDAIDGAGAGDYEAEIVSDITGTMLFLGVTAAQNIWIHGDTTGVNKWVLDTAASGAHVIRCSDTDITSILIEDLVIDGANQAASNGGVYITAGCATLTMNRVEIRNTSSNGIWILAGTVTTGNFNNVLLHNCGGSGFNSAVVDAATVNTFKNCAAMKNTSRGFFITNNANVTHNYYNCIAMGNSADDFEDAYTLPTSNVISCVSEDTTATSANHDATTNSIASASTTGPFTDYTNNDFHLTDTASNLWSITVDGGNTVTPDLDFVTRSANDTGPYEYPAAGGLPIPIAMHHYTKNIGAT